MEGADGNKPFHAVAAKLRPDDEGIAPHETELEESERDAEERRLFYVALTRARDELYILGGSQYSAKHPGGRPHEFIAEIESWMTIQGWPIDEPVPVVEKVGRINSTATDAMEERSNKFDRYRRRGRRSNTFDRYGCAAAALLLHLARVRALSAQHDLRRDPAPAGLAPPQTGSIRRRARRGDLGRRRGRRCAAGIRSRPARPPRARTLGAVTDRRRADRFGCCLHRRGCARSSHCV